MWFRLILQDKIGFMFSRLRGISEMCEDFEMQEAPRCWTSNTLPLSSILNKTIKEDRKSKKLSSVCVCLYLYDEAFVVAAAALWYQLVFEATAFLIQLHHRVFTSRGQDRTWSSGLQTERRPSQSYICYVSQNALKWWCFPKGRHVFPSAPSHHVSLLHVWRLFVCGKTEWWSRTIQTIFWVILEHNSGKNQYH